MRTSPIHLTVLPAEAPRFTVRKKSLFQSEYYVVAEWRDGTCVKVARFCEKSCADYWIEVESGHWTSKHQMMKAAA